MRIAILGAGGVGGYDGAVLARAGNEVQLLARGKHLEAIRTGGLRVTEADGSSWVARVNATDDPAALRGADLVLVTVKSYDLDAIAPVAADLARHGATVVPFLNGVDAADRLEQLGAPKQTLLGGLTKISAERPSPGQIVRRSPFNTAVVGELDGGLSARTAEIARTLTAAGIETRASAEIRLELWRKLVFITTMGTCCGLARTSIGPVRDAPLGQALLERATAESVAVGRALGIGFASDEVARVLEQVRSMAPGMKPSFLLDLERGGPTELDVLSGAVGRHGRQVGVPTPVHDAAVAAFGAALGLKA
ncbi:MAG TPA: ketopantoate reductase family protein [Myxococcaceae bacterium]|nr:ketopantoate reductase family protein [Myxococcaceae bacterium]